MSHKPSPRVPFKAGLAAIGLLALLVSAAPASAGMRWTARAIDPAQIDSLRRDPDLVGDVLFGESAKALSDAAAHGGVVDLNDPNIIAEMQASRARRVAEVGDSEIDLDKAWHAIHYLLTGRVDPDRSVASKVIWGDEDIGPDLGYGPARLLGPAQVRAVAKLLAATPPATLRKRYRPQKMTEQGVYPDVIWAREGDGALDYVLPYYERLVQFYRRAAERGQAVIMAIS